MSENATVPYWKDYQTNVIRGVVAAACCALVFAVIALVKHYRWRDDKHARFNANSYELRDRPETNGVHVTSCRSVEGIDNPALNVKDSD